MTDDNTLDPSEGGETIDELVYSNRQNSKELQKQMRKAQYKKAKEAFRNSPYAKRLKEMQRESRKASYQQAKARKKSTLSPSTQADETLPDQAASKETPGCESLWSFVKSGAEIKPKLRLVKDDEQKQEE
jgi:hypothetical protein